MVALFGCVVMAPARGATVLRTYSVTGTFNDGGTFSGTFGYDPVANAYADYAVDPDGFGQFNITTTAGSQGLAVQYLPGPETKLFYEDTNGSSPTELYIYGSFGSPGEFSTLTLNWNNPLNGTGGGNAQAITGGMENFTTVVPISGPCSPCYPEPYCVTTLQRQVAAGFVTLESTPVPLPPAAWLLLSGLGGLGLIVRRRPKGLSSNSH